MRVNIMAEPPSQDCGCASFLEHWESATHRKANRCSVSICTMPAGDAIVVTKPDDPEGIPYIVPVCRGHTLQKSGSLELREAAELIRHSLRYTCIHQTSPKVAT